MGEIERVFCITCGSKLETRELDGRKRHVCPACGFVSYINPVPAAAVVIIEDGRILLVKRAVEPKKGLWSLPAGFIETDETVRECAVREVKEETNLDIDLTGLLDVYTIFDDPRYVCLLVVYTAWVTRGELLAGDDADEAAYFSPDALPPVAFRKHSDAIAEAFRRLSE
jgi:ADP-ribose pyrophosphatase YjhB (NUDIX family)